MHISLIEITAGRGVGLKASDSQNTKTKHNKTTPIYFNKCRHGKWCVFKTCLTFVVDEISGSNFYNTWLYIAIICVPNIGLLEIPIAMDFVQPSPQNRQYFINECRNWKWCVIKIVRNFCCRRDIRIKFSHDLFLYCHNVCAKFGAHRCIRNTHCYGLCTTSPHQNRE